jgi:hypothetical protein
MTSLLNKVGKWFGKPEPPPDQCLQCGLKPGREYMISTDEPIMHPHKCSWCQSVVYMPGPMFACKLCSEDARQLTA